MRIGFRTTFVLAVGLFSAAKLLYQHYHSFVPKSSEITVRSNLLANHQIMVEDINLNGKDSSLSATRDSLKLLVGRHLRVNKHKGEALSSLDMTLSPTMPPTVMDSAIVPLQIRPEEIFLLKLLDAGKHIRIGDSATYLPNAIPVLAIHQATPDLPGNWMLIKIALKNWTGYQRMINSRTRSITLLSE